MITFTRAPTVAVGDAVTSTQLAKLADAFNDRLRSGLGDPTWRIIYYWLSLFRQVRNSDGGVLFPALAEFFTAGYQLLDPLDGEWPLTGPGEPEGSNVACQIMAYVFGAEAIGLDSEDIRLTDPDAGGLPLWINNGPPSTAEDYWALAKLQRGSFDPETGAQGSPAFDAAMSHYAIRMSGRSPHGNAYGGYLPTPELEGTPCDDPDGLDEIPAPTNYHIHFTALPEGLAAGFADVDYPGTCDPVPGGNDYASHVAGISYAPQAYYVWKNDGSVDVLPTAYYIEGPYTGEAALRKTSNGALNRAMNTFSREYRGSDTQRAFPTYWLQEAFDFQKFLTSQYHLAPNRGEEVDGVITAHYPLFRLTGSTGIASGTFATHTQSSTNSHLYDSNCVLTGCFITATKLVGSTTIELLNNATVIRSISITADADGNVSEITLLSMPSFPSPLKVRLAAAATFTDPTGKIEIECTELLARKPTTEDLFLTLRAGGAIDNLATDGRGIDEEAARSIGQTYFDNGAIANIHGKSGLPGQMDAVNMNGVFDAARRLSQCIRIIPRQNFVAYAVEDGKSICWFTRDATISGVTIDLFQGIGPGRDQVLPGGLKPDRKYVVRTGTISYHGKNYSVGQTFTAVSGDADFWGPGTLYEYDGIRPAAEPEGLTNEWLMGCQLKGYHPSESSLWKTSAYSDYFPLSNRCHFYSPEIANDPPLLWHTSYGQRVSGTFGGVLSPESPSGWNYAPLSVAWLGRNHVNQIVCDELDTACIEWRKNFYRSCRLYEPDPEIESAIAEFDGATELVKLTFKSRFHSSEDAPASIDRDIGTWDTAALRTEAETLRTVENALREYLVNQDDGTNATQSGPGNNAANSTVQDLPDNPYGSVFPHFLFTQLIPKPREDTNDTQQSTDTPITHDPFTRMELYLRAMCEGYVDGQTTTEYACEHGTSSIFDFTFQNLCYQAFQNRWFTLLPTTIRTDNPEGFGPLPNTELYAAIYNQFSAAVNLLTRVRVMLPMTLEVWKESADAIQYATVFDADGTHNSSCTTGVAKVFWDGTPPDASPSFVTPNWSVLETPSAYVGTVIDDTCVGSGWPIKTTRETAKIRWQTTDPDAVEAIPESWRDMLEEAPALFATVTRRTIGMGKRLVDLADSACCPCAPMTLGFWFNDPQYWAWVFDIVEENTCEIMPKIIEVPALGANTVARGKAVDDTVCHNGPLNDAIATPITDNAAMIEVPLV